jgi:hypothetical protein
MRLLKAALLAAVFCLPLALSAQVYNTVVFNRNGQPIAGASVAVCLSAPPQPLSSSNACGNGNFATLYTNQNLSTPGSNPVTTDAYGNAVIFAQPGVYWTVVYGYLITPHQNIIAVPSGSGGTPHNLLSTTHLDTVPYTPPVLGDLIAGNGSSKWARLAGSDSVTPQCLQEQGDGAGNVTSVTWGDCGAGAQATYQHNTVTVASQPKLNFLDTSTVIATVTNNSGNSSVDVSFDASAPPQSPPPPFTIPVGQSVAWAYPTACFLFMGNDNNPWNPAILGIGATDMNMNCSPTGGVMTRFGSGPLHDQYLYGTKWYQYAMPTLPNDAVIQHIYPIAIATRPGPLLVGASSIQCYSPTVPGGDAVHDFGSLTGGGYFSTNVSLGSTSADVTGAKCDWTNNSSVSASGDDVQTMQLTALAIYYTSATPQPTYSNSFFAFPYYPAINGVTPTFTTVADGSTINWNLTNQYIDNGIVALNHLTPTRTLNVSNMVSGGFYHLAFVQDSTGGAQVTLGTGCNWIVNNSPTSTLNIPLTANSVSIAEVVYDGTYCYADVTQNNSGTTLSNAGQWQPAPTGYVSGQIVQYNSCSYMAVGSSISIPPDTDNTKWALLACDGTNGANGTSGTNGTNGAPGAPGYSPNQVLSGGGVAWQSGLTFIVSPTSYLIANTQYACPLTGVTLTAADPSLDRIDAIICNTSGVATYVTGTPSATPAPPAIDITSQIQLTFVYVAAGATAPSDITVTDIYHENAEWTCAVSGATVVCNSSSTPHTGSLNIKYTAAASTAWAQQTIPSGTVDLGQWTNFVIWVKNDAVQLTTRSLVLQWFNGTTAKCTPVTIQSGNFGYDVTKTTWQQLVIPTSTFACSGIPVTRIRETVGGSGANLTIHLDDIQLQGGLAPPTQAAGLSCPDWSSTATYSANQCVYYSTTGSSYLALQTNTNKVPTNATNWKPLEIHAPAGVDGNLQIKSGPQFQAINSTWDNATQTLTLPGPIVATELRSTATTAQGIYLDPSTSPDLSSSGGISIISNAGVCQISQNGGPYTACSTAFGGGTVSSVGTTSPIVGGTITTTGTISCPTCAIGPGSSTANHLAKFSGTDGVTLADGGAIPTGTVSSVATTSPITGGTITGTGTIACATCVVASSPGAGIARFAGSTQTVTSAELSGDATTSGSNAVTLASKYKTHICEVVIGDPGSASTALANDNDTPVVCGNITGSDVTITAVACYADAGSPTVTPILTGGGGTSIVTGAITCGTASWAAGTINGTPTIHSFSANGATCSSTPCTLDANITTAGGTAKYIVMHFTIAQ